MAASMLRLADGDGRYLTRCGCDDDNERSYEQS